MDSFDLESCEMCSAFAALSKLCPLHAIGEAVLAGDTELAYRIAKQFSYPASTVRRMLRDKQDRELAQAVREMRRCTASLYRTLAARSAKVAA